MPLSPAKQTELSRALGDAAADRVLVKRPGVSPSGMQPLTGAATAPPLPASHITDSHLHIVRHKDSGCIQFVFPASVQAPALIPALTPASTPALAPAGGWDWLVQATLRAKERMTQGMIEKVEAHNKPERLLSLRHGFNQKATPGELAAARGRKVLLLLHGVFSSSSGAFADLAGDAGLQQLLDRYEARVFGYDHWTIAKTPQRNALDLLKSLPADANWDLDIICHSRGGLVVRSLLAKGGAWAGDMARYRAGRIRTVGKVMFVAAANQGSPLASPADIQQFLNVAAMLASFSGGMALDVVIGLARMVVSLGFGRPSVQALASGSGLIARLNSSASLLTSASTFYARANFDYGDSVLEHTGALLSRMLIDADNDLVVPYANVLLPGAPVSPERMLSFGSAEHKQNEVWHTEFFKQRATRDFLLSHLG
jgi:hypothetical protein